MTYSLSFNAYRKLKLNTSNYLKRQFNFSTRLFKFMDETIDRTYEKSGLQMLKSAFFITQKDDPSSYFCTEYTADILKSIGVYKKPGISSNNYTLYDYADGGDMNLNKGYEYEPERKIMYTY